MSQQERKSQITDSQKNCLVEYIKKNSDLQSGKFSNHFTYKDAQRKWTEIGTILNSMPGATRDWKTWRKTWQDLKSRTKTRVSSKKRHAIGTGGGPPIEGEFSKLEEDIIDIVKVASIEGHKGTAESAVNFNFDNDLYLEEQQHDILIVEEPSVDIEKYKHTETPKKQTTIENSIPIKKKTTTLRHTIDAVNDFKVGMTEKMAMKKNYYEEKIELLKRIARAKERKANASERQADAKERYASANERIATALESIAESIL